MVVAKTQVRSQIEVAERAARKEDLAIERIHCAVLRPARARARCSPGAKKSNGCRSPNWRSRTSSAPIIKFEQKRPSGKHILEVEHLSKAYGDQQVIKKLHGQHHARRENRAHGTQRCRQDHAAERAAGEFSDDAGRRTAQDQRVRRPVRRRRKSHLGTRGLDRLLRAGSPQPHRRWHDRDSNGCISGTARRSPRNCAEFWGRCCSPATKPPNRPACFPAAKQRGCCSAN